MATKITRKDARLLKREIKALTYRDKGDGEKSKARRVQQMVHEQLKADNGVLPRYEDVGPSYICTACAEPTGNGATLCETCAGLLDKEEHDG